MNAVAAFATALAPRSVPVAPAVETVIALHATGGSPRQWRPLAEELGRNMSMIAPELGAAAAALHRDRAADFTLADEAAPVVAMIDALRRPVHLVGHSYGGAVALQAALARPNRVASLSLYEPTAFSVLRATGGDGAMALQGMRSLAAAIERTIAAGDSVGAAERFVTAWGGPGAWAATPPGRQAALARQAVTFGPHFRALFADRTPLAAFRYLRMPVLLLQGERAPTATALVVRRLSVVLRRPTVRLVFGAGHLGPLTHAGRVTDAVAAHIEHAETISPFTRALMAEPFAVAA